MGQLVWRGRPDERERGRAGARLAIDAAHSEKEGAVGELRLQVDPGSVGLDGSRLARIEEHFRGYVDDGRLPGWLVAVSRHGRVAYLAHYGMMDLEAAVPVAPETIWRIYSMTKPITSLAVMMLYEKGAFDLRDPVEEFIPSFAKGEVFTGGDATRPITTPVRAPIRIWHLLTHTAGLSYGSSDHPVDDAYRRAETKAQQGGAADLAHLVDVWATQPLRFEPGSAWFYSRATDVLGRLVEVVSGQRLDEFFAEHIFGPLKMDDTSFVVPESKLARMASLYEVDPGTRRATPASSARAPRTSPFLSGGGGLFSTASDYHRFCHLLLAGGELDGVRLVGPRTLEFMTTNQLPEGRGLDALAIDGASETPWEGMDFGLGFSVCRDPARSKIIASPGEFGWGGAASTAFWVDPREQLIVMFFTQLRPSSTWPIRARLHQLVHQAIVEPLAAAHPS